MTDVTVPADEDESWIAAFKAGREEAFEALYRKYLRRFLAIARRFLGSVSEAEDVTQETFLDIHAGLLRFRQEARFETWACRILTRKCLALRRGWFRRPVSLEAVPEIAADGDAGLESLVIQQALRKLPAEARMILILRYYEQLSIEEIAEIMGTNIGQMKMRLHRARNAMKDLLRPPEGGEER